MRELLLKHFDLLAQAPDGVARLRELILTLAVQGKLVPQDPNDEPASVLLQRIRAEKDRLVAEGKIKRDKSLAPITDEEKPYKLPKGWEWQALAEVGSWAIGSGFPHEAQGRVGLPILFAKVSDMNLPGNELKIVNTNHTIDEDTVESLRINVHPAGTVVFPKIGGAIATNKRRILVRPTAIDNNCLGITPSRAMSTGYLFLLLSAIDFTDYQAGTSVPALSQGTLGQIPVGLPPLPEQVRIVARVEELMRLCDALEAKQQLDTTQHAQLVQTLLGTLTDSTTPEELATAWQRVATHFDLLLDRPEAVDALEQTILQLAVRGLLVPQDPTDEPASVLLQRIRAEKDRLIAEGKIKRDKPLPPITDQEKPFELPQGWEWVRIDGVSEVQGGIQKTPLRRPVKNHHPYLRVANVQRDAFKLNDIERYELTDEELARWCLRPNDLLIVEGNGSEDEIGRCAVWSGQISDCVFQNHLIRVRCFDPACVQFLKLFLNSPSGTDEMKRLAITTSGLYNLSVGKIRNFAFPLPPRDEQTRIVALVAELRHLCAGLRQRLNASRSTQGHAAEYLVENLAA